MESNRIKYATNIAATWFVVASGSLALAGNHNDILSVGDSAPPFSLTTTEGTTLSLDDLSSNKATVMVFLCSSCPAARSYTDRIKQFTRDYQAKGVAVVAIHVHRDETAEDAARQAQGNEFNFPYLLDETQQIAKSYGAATTPHVFVLEADHRIAFMGAIDDHLSEKKVQKQFLRSAVDAILAGKKPALAETRPFGCAIRYQ